MFVRRTLFFLIIESFPLLFHSVWEQKRKKWNKYVPRLPRDIPNKYKHWFVSCTPINLQISSLCAFCKCASINKEVVRDFLKPLRCLFFHFNLYYGFAFVYRANKRCTIHIHTYLRLITEMFESHCVFLWPQAMVFKLIIICLCTTTEKKTFFDIDPLPAME